MKSEGGADRPSLFIFFAGLCLLAGSLFTDRWYQWLGIALLALAWAPWRTYPANLLGVLVGAYCAWLLANAVFVTPVHSAESLYQPLMLFGGFAALAAASEETRAQIFRAGVLLVATLVLIGVLQYFFGFWHLQQNATRAAGTFMTPNTFATAINLFLAPLAALYLAQGSRRLLALSLWLFAGLVASQSRGGMLAFFVGLAFIGLALGPAVLRASARRWLVFLGGCALVWALMVVLIPLMGGSAGEALFAAPWLDRVTWDRADLYAAAVTLILERPAAGAGANMFFPLFEMIKPDTLRDGEFYYVHNDYLQIWLEFGLLGLLLLLAIVAASLGSALVACRRRLTASCLACGSALATCFAHAVVDFPLYVPFILLIVGAYLGTIAHQAGGPALADRAMRSIRFAWERIGNPVRFALVFAAFAWLAQPMVAEMAVLRSIALLLRGDASDAIYWQSVAQRFEPRHPAHYWAEATIWREQAVLTRRHEFAARADALLAEGIKVNPYDAAVRIARVELHRRHADLLDSPASPPQVLAWAQEAARLRPQHVGVQAELARALAYAGKGDEARSLARALVQKYPELKFPRRLAAEL